MRVTFAGVGEAFDENFANTSLLVESANTSLLIDCGFTAASEFWKTSKHPLELDGVYISHFHGDHYFGIPALLVRFVQEGRTKPLKLIGQQGIEARIDQLLTLAYPNSLSKAKFDIQFIESSPETKVALGDMHMEFAFGDHPMPCLAVKVEANGKAVFHSSDGRPTEETRALASGCQLIVHESFTLETDSPGHGTVDSSIKFGQQAGADTVTLVHIRREVRRDKMPEIKSLCKNAGNINVLVPQPGDCVEI